MEGGGGLEDISKQPPTLARRGTHSQLASPSSPKPDPPQIQSKKTSSPPPSPSPGCFGFSPTPLFQLEPPGISDDALQTLLSSLGSNPPLPKFSTDLQGGAMSTWPAGHWAGWGGEAGAVASSGGWSSRPGLSLIPDKGQGKSQTKTRGVGWGGAGAEKRRRISSLPRCRGTWSRLASKEGAPGWEGGRPAERAAWSPAPPAAATAALPGEKDRGT